MPVPASPSIWRDDEGVSQPVPVSEPLSRNVKIDRRQRRNSNRVLPPHLGKRNPSMSHTLPPLGVRPSLDNIFSAPSFVDTPMDVDITLRPSIYSKGSGNHGLVPPQPPPPPPANDIFRSSQQPQHLQKLPVIPGVLQVESVPTSRSSTVVEPSSVTPLTSSKNILLPPHVIDNNNTGMIFNTDVPGIGDRRTPLKDVRYERECKTPPLPQEAPPIEQRHMLIDTSEINHDSDTSTDQQTQQGNVFTPPDISIMDSHNTLSVHQLRNQLVMMDTSEIHESHTPKLIPQIDERRHHEKFMDVSEVGPMRSFTNQPVSEIDHMGIQTDIEEVPSVSDITDNLQKAKRKHSQRGPPAPPPPPERVFQIDDGIRDVSEPIRLPVNTIPSTEIFNMNPVRDVCQPQPIFKQTELISNDDLIPAPRYNDVDEVSNVQIDRESSVGLEQFDLRPSADPVVADNINFETDKNKNKVQSVSFNPILSVTEGTTKQSFNSDDNQSGCTCPKPKLLSPLSVRRNKKLTVVLAVGCFLLLFFLIFGIIVSVSLGRSDIPIDSRCEGVHHYPYTLSGKFSSIRASNRFQMDISQLSGLAFQEGTTLIATKSSVFNFHGEGSIFGIKLNSTGSLEHVDLPQISSVVNLHQPTGVTIASDGGVWVADRSGSTIHQLSDTSTKVTLGSIGVSGRGNLSKSSSFPSERLLFGNGNLDLSSNREHVKVLDTNNCAVHSFSSTGAFISSIGSCSELSDAVSVASAERTTYVATQSGIVVYDDSSNQPVVIYSLNVPSSPLDYFKFSLLRESWRGKVSSISFTPTGHLLTTEGSRVQVRDVAGNTLCAFGDLREPVAAVMLPDLRIVVAERDRILVFSVSSE